MARCAGALGAMLGTGIALRRGMTTTSQTCHPSYDSDGPVPQPTEGATYSGSRCACGRTSTRATTDGGECPLCACGQMRPDWIEEVVS
jgi:hypothetical protein